MKHHFGDLLDRTSNYWTTIPNQERYSFIADRKIGKKEQVKILTISKYHEKKHWKQIFDCPNLEELTLHDPGKEQVQAIRSLKKLKRLRVTFFRATDLDFIADLPNLEELVLEYVSGFSDLSPLAKLKKLRSLHLENLRRVTDFDGLTGLRSLRYLHIDGTLDWNQPITCFDFLQGLTGLEVFSLGFISCKAGYPALLPLLKLKKLKKIHIGRNMFNTPDFAFLKAAFPKLEGCDWDLCWDFNDNYEFLGKRAGFVRKNSPQAEERCAAFISSFEKMKKEAEAIIKSNKK